MKMQIDLTFFFTEWLTFLEDDVKKLAESLSPTDFLRRGISKLLRNLSIKTGSPGLQTGRSIVTLTDEL
jgi:hypothetical protein